MLKSSVRPSNRGQFEKYLCVGVANLLFTLAVCAFFVKVVATTYTLAFSVSWLAGVFFTCAINFLWVFKPEDKLEFRRRFHKYFIVQLSSYVLNLSLLRLLCESLDADPLVVQNFLLPLVVGINFLGMNHWSLQKTPARDHP